MTLSLIAAMAQNGVIGIDNRLPWRLPEDLKRFKSITLGHVLIMGRKTFQSIGKALPGRDTIVVSRSREFAAPGARVVASLDAALAAAGDGEVFIAGGAELYAQTIARADRLYLTVLDAPFDGDARFPAFDERLWRVRERERRDGFEFRVYERV
jgi:dihydrofolate reductase